MLQILLHKSYKLWCQLSSTKPKENLLQYVIDKGRFIIIVISLIYFHSF